VLLQLQQAVDADLADVTVPDQGNMFKTELYEVIKLKQRKFKRYKPNNLLAKYGNSVLLAKRGNSILRPLPPSRIQPHEKSICCY